ncbi:WD40 repeat-like protein [Marasmius fiardii PR-910]|nr:WD40 repeat-like protein [Marasmius fiardii PR-910]
MIQTGLIQNAHSDLVTDASYDYYGLRLATCGLDQRIKIWQLDGENGTWSVEDDWKAHDAAVSKVSWAHPEFGPIIASSSFDRTVKIWEQTIVNEEVNGASSAQPAISRWVERAVLLDARGTVRAVEFAPHHFGLKLATISTDNFLRIYECLEQPSLTTWQLSEEVDVLSIPSTYSSYHSRAHTVALATPTQTHASLDGAPASLVAQALLQQQTSTPARPGLGNREADGGWCISWCKDRYWGEVIAAGCGVNGLIKIIQLSPSRRPTTLLVLDPNVPPTPLAVPALPSISTREGGGSPSGSNLHPQDSEQPTPHSIVSVSWAPSCGRSYHLIATGSRDGRVRIWKVKPAIDHDDLDEMEDADAPQDEGSWSAMLVADHDDHKSCVGRVDWNVTGTILSSAGNDGRIRLWKATIGGNIWRPAGTIGVEQNPETDQNGRSEDVDMQ